MSHTAKMDVEVYSLKVIGYMRSPFLYKNGTPRQPGICHQVKGTITIDKKIFNNPEHSLEGLEKFSHIWIFFIFHKNNNEHFKAKVKPPRLDGAKTGVFSTRSPYRPNNIGLTLAKIESVKGDTVTVSGIDILDGTPIIDLKPFIPQYDNPTLLTTDLCTNQSESRDVTTPDTKIDQSKTEIRKFETLTGVGENAADSSVRQQNCELDLSSKIQNQNTEYTGTELAIECKDKSNDGMAVAQSDLTNCEDNIVLAERVSDVLTDKLVQNCSWKASASAQSPQLTSEKHDSKCSSTADWISKSPVSQLTVRFTPSAEDQLKLFRAGGSDEDYRLQFLKSFKEAKEAIINILHEDPRSTYRRNNCPDSLYYFTLDVLHVTCWFDENLVEIVRVKPVGKVAKLKEKK